MKPVRILFSLLMFGLVAGLAATGLAKEGVPEWLTVSALTLATFAKAITKNATSAMDFTAAVEVELWVNYIIERLWKDNYFLKMAFDDDQHVLAGKIVHIPQPGSKPTVVKGRTSFPAAAVRRTDTDIVYALEEYTTDPTHIQDAEKVEVSYSKIDSVFGDHAGAVTEAVANDMIIKWASLLPQANIVETTGTLGAAKHPGQTGNRRAMVHKDLKAAALKMDLQDVPAGDRYALLDANMHDEFLEGLSEQQYRDFSKYYDAKTNVVGELYGFKIMKRSSVGMSAAALNGSSQLVMNALGAVTGATDTAVAICWHKNSVTRALGEVKFFENPNDPQFYGDVYSALLRMGGRRRRANNEGVVVIKQASA